MKKIVSLLLCLVFILCAVNLTVFADEDTQNNNEQPTGVIYTAKKDGASPWFITKPSGGLFTTKDIKDGKLVFSQYMYNENDFDLHFTPALQTATKAGPWEGPAGKAMSVAGHSGAWITLTADVNSDNTITVRDENYPIESFFLRLSFACDIPKDSKFVITTDSDKVTNMKRPSGAITFNAKETNDAAYANPPEQEDTSVDPDFHISTAFGSHMVLQRDRLVPVWGISTYTGETVTVSFKGQTKTTTVGQDGKWSVTFDSMPADKTPAELTATCKDKTHKLTDILVGDVFIIGGQSNSDMPLSSCGNVYSSAYKQQLIDSAEGNVRFFRQGKLDAMAVKETMNTPQYEPINGNVWTTETLGTANTFCAYGFFFAHKVYDGIDVPVGMIMAASAGSPISQLMSKEASEKTGYDRYENNIPVSGMYNALMSPFVKMSFKAMLYFQGESEHGLAKSQYGKYNEYLNAYVEDLREKNGYNFPFYYAQVSSYQDMFSGMAEQRAVMYDGLNVIKNSGMIVTMDQGARKQDPDYAHARYKEPIGNRFADLVLTRLYGVGDESYVTSPMPVYAYKTAEGVVVKFKNVGDGLKRIGQHEKLSGFKLDFGSVKRNVEAEIISKDEVLLREDRSLNQVKGVAYALELMAFVDYPEGNGDLKYVANLGNSNDLPAPTFKIKTYETEAEAIAAITPEPTEEPQTTEVPSDNNNNDNSDSGVWIGVAIVGIAVVVALIVVVIALKKKKSE